jgi:hypothetical protein
VHTASMVSKRHVAQMAVAREAYLPKTIFQCSSRHQNALTACNLRSCRQGCPGGGRVFCIHKVAKTVCDKGCGGGSLCKHGILRTLCLDGCGGGSLCIHKVPRSQCNKGCGGGSFCLHNIRRSDCVLCDGSHFCIHKIRKINCKPCDGAYVCTNGDCRTITHVANTMCHTCCPTPRTNTLVDEIRVAGKLKEWSDNQLLAEYTTWNRQNPHADPVQCGRYRPDFLWDIVEEQRVVILECDEHAHRRETVRCEFVRTIEVAISFGGAPVHMIRYNPDLLACVKTMPERKEREALLLERMQAAL